MLQLFNVRKSYTTANFTQVALDDVSIAFRDNEFVAILGPSGSGKTTLLNIVGGLDHYDSGDLVIDSISTKQYRDRDWDSYRNNRIGFVFQSYNLIPHQTVLANVELALTLSGVSRAERRERATAALERVGLADHIRKLPSQLSGGQMQRVAIARALINDPEILLADEPTGALDSTTSVQIMALLTEIAKDRLVVMVTHNPELAEEYATRIVNLKDGVISDDSDPFLPTEEDSRESTKPVRKTSMSFLTAIALSFKNLMTKKGRTLMTAFAGSIGIIGIAAILALANGVNDYIQSIEEDTLSVYPLTIQSQGMDFTSLLAASADDATDTSGDVHEIQMMTRMFQSIGSNDLASLKKFLDDDGGNINDYANSIQYSYNVTPQIFTETDGKIRQVNPDSSFASLGFGGGASSSSLISSSMNTNVFNELADDTSLIKEQYDVVAGHWPENYDDVVVVLTPSGGISDLVTYAMGLRDPSELDTMIQQMLNDEPITTPKDTKSFSYQQIMGVSFTLVNAVNYFQHDDSFGVWTDKSSDADYLKNLVNKGETLHVAGVVQPKSGATATALQPGMYYSSSLTRHLIDQASHSAIVQAQVNNPGVDVFTGRTFADEEANPTRNDFDMSSLMTVDENALAGAFTIDESQLKIDPSALNLTVPDLKIDPSSLPALNLDGLFDGINLDGLIGTINVDDILKGIDVSGISGSDLGIDPAKISDLSLREMQGYLAYCAAHVPALDPTDAETNFPLFLASPDGQALQAEAESIAGGINQNLTGIQEALTQQLVNGITQAIQKQVTANSAALENQIAGKLQTAMTQYMNQAMNAVSAQIQAQLGHALETQITQGLNNAMDQLASTMSSAMEIDQQKFLSAFHLSMDQKELTQLLMSMMSTEKSSYDGNLAKLGYADFAKPSQIDIYPKDFESKGHILNILDSYNSRMKAQGADEKVITYTDIVGTLMSSVTTIVNVVSYVLVAFVSISLIVSSIMIGVITYISVLERKKEIGILRSIGASKRDIRRVFNAETLIVGFVAGMIGIGATLLLTLPANAIVSARFNISHVAQLPWQAGAILVAISMGLTFLAGLIPSSAASRKDPVEALRSE